MEIPSRANHHRIETALVDGDGVLAKIMIRGSIPHWVLITGKQSGDYLIKDPLGNGRTLDRLSKYRSRIHAIRIVKRCFNGPLW